MGFLGFGSSTPAPRDDTAPDRTARAKCWAARDAFFACLDEHSIHIKTLKQLSEEDKPKCARQLEGFRAECKGSWVDYFVQKREVDRKKEELMKTIEKEKAQRMG